MSNKLCLGCMTEYDEKYKVCPHCGYEEGTPAKEAYHLAPGTVLAGKYAVGRVVGYGGFGITYAAYDLSLGKKVAIKEYFPSEMAGRSVGETKVTAYSGKQGELFSKGVEKFFDEARCLVKFNTVPGIVSVLDVFKENNTSYIVMEYLEGQTLRDYLKELAGGKEITENGEPVRFKAEDVIAIMLPVLSALSEVHKEGLIHRDISPDNIFVTEDGQVKLIDFGAARYVDNNEKSLSIILKHGYAPPEQYRSKGKQGPWTDVYACAALMYKLITGVLPDNAMDREEKDTLVPPSKLGVDIGPERENALMNALNLPVEKRTQSTEQLARELTSGKAVKRVETKQKKSGTGRMPGWFKIASVIIVAGLVAVIVLFATGILGDKKIKTGSRLGKNEVRVPEIVNYELDVAEEKLQKEFLAMKIVGKENSDEIPEDLVLSQDPDSGSAVSKKSFVNVKVSAGEITGHMPYLLGSSEEEAKRELNSIGLGEEINIAVKKVSSAIAPGHVVGQSFSWDETIKKDDKITISVSDGIEDYDLEKQTSVPAFEGKTWEQCVEEAQEAHIYVYLSEVVYKAEVAVGEVTKQDVKEGEDLKEGNVVGLSVNLGEKMVFVPDVQYKELKEAEALLKAAGLKSEVKIVSSETVADGHVVSQRTRAGRKVEKGSTVVLKISNAIEAEEETNENTEQPKESKEPEEPEEPEQPKEPEEPELDSEEIERQKKEEEQKKKTADAYAAYLNELETNRSLYDDALMSEYVAIYREDTIAIGDFWGDETPEMVAICMGENYTQLSLFCYDSQKGLIKNLVDVGLYWTNIMPVGGWNDNVLFIIEGEEGLFVLNDCGDSFFESTLYQLTYENETINVKELARHYGDYEENLNEAWYLDEKTVTQKEYEKVFNHYWEERKTYELLTNKIGAFNLSKYTEGELAGVAEAIVYLKKKTGIEDKKLLKTAMSAASLKDNELKDFLNLAMYCVPEEYDCNEIDEKNMNILAGIVNEYYCTIMSEDKSLVKEEVSNSKVSDPRGWAKIGKKYSYFVIDAEKAEWIAQMIYHASPGDIKKMAAQMEKDKYAYKEKGDDGKEYYYIKAEGIGGTTWVEPAYAEYDGEKYYLIYDVLMPVEYSDELYGSYYAELGYEEIDGKYYWTMYRHSTTIPEDNLNLPAPEIIQRLAGEYSSNIAPDNGGSSLVIKADGTFEFTFSSWHVLENGANGTYHSSGKARFANPVKINSYTYSLDVVDISYDNKAGSFEDKYSDEGELVWRYDYIESPCFEGGKMYFYVEPSPLYQYYESGNLEGTAFLSELAYMTWDNGLMLYNDNKKTSVMNINVIKNAANGWAFFKQ